VVSRGEERLAQRFHAKRSDQGAPFGVELSATALGLFSLYQNSLGYHAPSRYFFGVRASLSLISGKLIPYVAADLPRSRPFAFGRVRDELRRPRSVTLKGVTLRAYPGRLLGLYAPVKLGASLQFGVHETFEPLSLLVAHVVWVSVGRQRFAEAPVCTAELGVAHPR
jgi:hypothetical protein